MEALIKELVETYGASVEETAVRELIDEKVRVLLTALLPIV